MRNHTVEIGDTQGETFRVKLSTPNAVESIRSNRGVWRAVDKGYIKFTSGVVIRFRSKDDSTDSGLQLFFRVNEGWGIRLDDYEDFIGVNDQGGGSIMQPWVLKLKPGPISWALLD